MTAERIAELRALAEKATPGPWHWRSTYDDGEWPHLLGAKFENGVQVRVLEASDVDGCVDLLVDGYDSAFIAAARTALPEALDEVERLGRIIDRIEDLAIKSDWYDFPKNELLDLVAESAP